MSIGGGTPFAMASNHATALNHSFRSTAGFRADLQKKVKCSFCGCWATRGRSCYQCGRLSDGAYSIPKRNDLSELSAIHAATPRTRISRDTSAVVDQPSAPTQRSSSKTARPATAAGDRSGARGGTDHQKAAAETAKKMRVKCRSCGCWAYKLKPCTLCRSIN